MNIGFCAAASLLDTQVFFSQYKSVSYALAMLIVFLTGVIAFIHPVVLRSIKKVKTINTDDCYMRTLRLGRASEIYVHSKVLLGSIIALSIPLCPPLVAIVVMSSITVFKLITASQARFTSKYIRIGKLLYILFHLLLNLTLFVIYVVNFNRDIVTVSTYMIIGWVAIGFIFGCITIDVILIVVSLAH